MNIFQGADYESWVIFSPSGAVDIQYSTDSSDISLLERDERPQLRECIFATENVAKKRSLNYAPEKNAPISQIDI